MRFNVRGVLLLGIVTTIVGSGCGSDSGGGGTIKSTLKSGSGATSGALSLTNEFSLMNLFRYDLTGGSGASGLTSMKYYINSISICKNLTTSGTAYSNQSGCIDLYTATIDSAMSSNGSTPDYATMMTHAKSVTTGFVDLLDSTDRAKLSGTATLKSGDSGDYKWGLVNWAYPIKVKGTVTLSDGSSVVTKDGTYSNYSGTGGGKNTATSLTGTAEEAVVTLPNGGTWFAFQTPFVVDETKTYSIDLVFNPDGILKAQTPAASNNPILTDGTRSMSIPFLNLSPVPHQSTDTVTKETYLARVDSSSTHFNIRLELYYVTGDTSKTIYGVDVQTIAISGVDSDQFFDFQKISYVENSGTTLTFQDYHKATLISGFTMKDTAGQTTTATVGCTATGNMPGCGTTLTFTRQ